MHRYRGEALASSPYYQSCDTQGKRVSSSIHRFYCKPSHSLIYDLVPVGLDLVFGDILKFFSTVGFEAKGQ